jgi:hypothetical protein
VDGLSVEVSVDGAETWTTIFPLGGYPNGFRWTGMQATFTEAVFPLNGLSGPVQFAFRFLSVPPNEGLGWWIDDVQVTGTDDCAATLVAINRFDAIPLSDRPGVRLEWNLSEETGAVIKIERASAADGRRPLVILPWETRSGSYVDDDVVAVADRDPAGQRLPAPGHRVRQQLRREQGTGRTVRRAERLLRLHQ